jgi:hypothetical protein
MAQKTVILRIHCQKRHLFNHIATTNATLLGQSVIIQPSVMENHALAQIQDAAHDETKSV